MTSDRIIVVDDDAGIREAVADYLAAAGFEVRTASNGIELDQRLQAQPTDLIVLDIMLPGEDGLSICRRMSGSAHHPPVILLTARGQTVDRIVGLEIGAADYLPKPFDPRELLARIKAVLRRPIPGEAMAEVANGWEFDGWRMLERGREVFDPNGRRVQLTRGEFMLMQAFVERPGRILTREMLLDISGRESEGFDRSIDLAVSRLRKSLATHGGEHLIATVRGEGYRFDARTRRC